MRNQKPNHIIEIIVRGDNSKRDTSLLICLLQLQNIVSQGFCHNPIALSRAMIFFERIILYLNVGLLLTTLPLAG